MQTKKRPKSDQVSQVEHGEAAPRPPTKKIAKTFFKQHDTTHAEVRGLGKEAAKLPGKLASEKLWDFLPSPKWLPPVSRRKSPPGGLGPEAAVEVELARSRALGKLRHKLQDLCQEAGIAVVPKLAFEKWRFSAKWREDMDYFLASTAGQLPKSGKKSKGAKHKAALPGDPLIPYTGCQRTDAQLIDTTLVNDLVRAGAEEAVAKTISEALAMEAQTVSKEVQKLKHQLESGRPVMTPAQLPALIAHKHSLDISCAGNFVKLTFLGLQKLQLLYSQHAPLCDEENLDGIFKEPEVGSTTKASHFICRLFCLLLRYKIIQGHGFQAAAGPEVFRVLNKRLGVALECFASPLNSFYGRYCSAFPDVDSPFGSQGSFWSFQPTSGSFQANPPFVPCIMDAMADRLESLLVSAEAKSAPLSFAVFIPGWQECLAWGQLQRSTFLRAHIVVAAVDHGYCDGASHQRKDSFRVSCYDTGVFFLQTSAAAKKWVVSEDILEDLRISMAQSVPSTAAEMRQKRSK